MLRNSPAVQTKKENPKPQLWSFYLHKEEHRNSDLLQSVFGYPASLQIC